MSEAADATVVARREGVVGAVLLNRPRALNALDIGMIRGIRAALDAWRDDAAVKLALLEGAGGKAFCAGGDIRGLRDDIAPIGEIAAVREGVQQLPGELAALREEMRPIQQLEAVRVGIDPLDDDMRAVKHSVDELEPLIRELSARLGALDDRIESLRSELSPLGDLADRIPGINRR